MKKRFERHAAGQGLTEFAIVLPLLVLIILGLFDLGYATFLNNMLANAAREGARTGIIITSTDNDIRTRVRAAAAGLNLSDSQIVIAPTPNRSFGEPITVTLTLSYKPLTPVLGPIVGGSLPLRAESAMIVEGVIEY
jgi:Flp pilus assembly protein TadG